MNGELEQALRDYYNIIKPQRENYGLAIKVFWSTVIDFQVCR
jgi:hypothetical protein